MGTQIAERSFQLWFRVAPAENRLRFFGAPASLARGSRRPSSRRGRLLETNGALDNIERPALRLGINAPDIEPDHAGHQHVGAAKRGDDDNRRTPTSLEARVS